jgi:phytoene dehydrogenase-like protein
MSRYAYLVSLLPAALVKTLGLKAVLRARDVLWYAPHGDTGVLVDANRSRTREAMLRATRNSGSFESWERFQAMLARLARRVFPTLIEPMRSREQLRRLVDDEFAWQALFEDPLALLLERTFESDLLRGVVCTDATIGTFAPADDPFLRQNRCFLYHVIGNGTGRWDVPVGGMGALSGELASSARRAGTQIQTRCEVVSMATDGATAEVTCADSRRFQARHILVNVAPTVLSQLLGDPSPAESPEGSQLKINMLLTRLPRLRDADVPPEQAFTGTFHVNERYSQLRRAYDEAAQGQIPTQPPCELYCHSLTDPSILAPDLRAAGAQTLTLFGLHMPARLFSAAPEERKREAVEATLRSVDSVLAEPLEDCLSRTPEGEPCLEALTPLEVEEELGMPGGHIFHRDLAWPYAESEAEVGKWGVETEHPNIWLCGAGARRGGGVSGIPGHNAARAVLAAS